MDNVAQRIALDINFCNSHTRHQCNSQCQSVALFGLQVRAWTVLVEGESVNEGPAQTTQ